MLESGIQNTMAVSNPAYVHTICSMWKTLCEQSSIKKTVVKTVDEKYPDELLLLARFWKVRPMNTVLSHEAMRDNLWMGEAAQLTWVGHVINKQVNVVQSKSIHTIHIHTI